MRTASTICLCLLLAVIAIPNGGCTILGFLASPTWHEQKIPAEYRIKDQQDRKILVFVDEVSGANVGLTFRRSVAQTFENYLIGRTGVKSTNIVSRRGIDYLRQNRDDFSLMTPAEVGKELGAGLVLYVLIEDYELYGMTEESYYRGSLLSRSVLFDSDTGTIVWPDKKGEPVDAIVELDTNRDSAVQRLAAATARTITNRLFDCPRDEMKVSDIRDEAYNW
ncbi:hypothetical protein STSP2_01698 [Anaerohalosphaera lusitana]|uniref:Curli production assembly/transport component CsgG n=1 Tax=Anaerohalosphaera lusitana TaxID=1936003 RepID=A0A1U9NKS2_9BACT|nr:hypothetical protein [Anaerohalosphaera lusitana]AQT68533.1 hypothetical protein STSP2_01698 [Anaerohalosphaera lusitana]